MKIKSKTIDKDYFEEQIDDFMCKNNIQKSDVISITQDKNFTTLWYWGLL